MRSPGRSERTSTRRPLSPPRADPAGRRAATARGDRAAATLAHDRVGVPDDAVLRAHGRAPQAVVAAVRLDPERRALMGIGTVNGTGGASVVARTAPDAPLGDDRETHVTPFDRHTARRPPTR